jgi:hypothetical protein
VQCGNEADWDCTVSIWEWAKLIALSLAISVSLTAVVAAGVWLIARWPCFAHNIKNAANKINGVTMPKITTAIS